MRNEAETPEPFLGSPENDPSLTAEEAEAKERAAEREAEPIDPRWVCREIAADMWRDAAEFDGKPFNGRTVAEYFGNQGAAIAALAKIVERMLDQLGAKP